MAANVGSSNRAPRDGGDASATCGGGGSASLPARRMGRPSERMHMPFVNLSPAIAATWPTRAQSGYQRSRTSWRTIGHVVGWTYHPTAYPRVKVYNPKQLRQHFREKVKCDGTVAPDRFEFQRDDKTWVAIAPVETSKRTHTIVHELLPGGSIHRNTADQMALDGLITKPLNMHAGKGSYRRFWPLEDIVDELNSGPRFVGCAAAIGSRAFERVAAK